MRSWPARLLASVALAGTLASLAYVVAPTELDVTTDIVGYPTFANFDIDRYFLTYGLAVVLFPLATLGFFLLLTRVFVGRLGPWRPFPPPSSRVEDLPVARGWGERAVALGRMLFVGAVLGLEAGVVLRPLGALGVVVALAVLYSVLVALAALLLARLTSRTPRDLVSLLNALGASTTVVALYGVSRATRVDVASTGAVHDYPWLPIWLALAGGAASLVWLSRQLGRTERFGTVERNALLLVVGPVALFLLVASLPGALGTVDLYEEGQVLAASDLVRDGSFPWRDVLVAHGLLHDVAGGLVGTQLFEDSRWGVVAGQTMVLEPLTWVALYYLCAYLFGANWLYLLLTQLVVISGHVSPVHVRFLLLPLVLLVLVALLKKATVVRAAAFTSLLALQVVVTPEAIAAAVAYLGTLVVFELYYYERGTGPWRGFRRAWLCLASGVVLALGWALSLAAVGALDDWVFSFTTLIPGHRLTGGIPLLVSKTRFEVVAPIALVLLTFAFFVARSGLRRPLAFQDWAMGATAGLTLLYYAKFLGRADVFHLEHSYSVAVPLLFYAGYRGAVWVEPTLARIARTRGARRFPARHTVTLTLLVVFVLLAAPSLWDATRAAPTHFARSAHGEPEIVRIGFAQPGDNDVTMIRDVDRALSALVEPGDTVFDFSNAPGLFHYLLDLPPATRYYHVSLAIRQRTQADLIRLLEESRPEVVVLTSDRAGLSLPIWDGIANQVRHYDVSQYLLDAYVPVLDAHGFVLMKRRDSGAHADPALYFRVDPCDWGYVPSFFAPRPDASAGALPLETREVGPSGRHFVVTVSPHGSAGVFRWLELDTGKPLREGRFTLSDRPGAGAGSKRSISFRTLDRNETTVRLPVGSCSQWHGYRSGLLHLTSSVPQDLREVRLVR